MAAAAAPLHHAADRPHLSRRRSPLGRDYRRQPHGHYLVSNGSSAVDVEDHEGISSQLRSKVVIFRDAV